MLLKIFTVYDSKTEAYLPPFYSNTTGQAMRDFESACNDKNHNFNKYPADFTMFELGTFNDADCSINLLESKISLGTAIEFVTQTEIPLNQPELKEVKSS